MDPLWRSRLFSSLQPFGGEPFEVSRLGLFNALSLRCPVSTFPEALMTILLYSLRSTLLHYDDVGVLPGCIARNKWNADTTNVELAYLSTPPVEFGGNPST